MSTGILEGLKTAEGGWDTDKLIQSATLGFKAYSATAGANDARALAEGQRRAMEFNAATERNNAIMREYQARDAITRGQKAEAMHRMKVASLFGRQRAAMAAKGIALDEGSPLAILTDTLQMGEIDSLSIRDNAAKEAWGFRVEGANASARSGMYAAQGSAINPNRAFTSSLLTRATSVAKGWYDLAGTTPPTPKTKSKYSMDEWGVYGETTY